MFAGASTLGCVRLLCVFHVLWAAAGLVLFLTWYKNTLSPPCFKQKAGICADAPGLCRSRIPCLSLKSVGTNTGSRTGFESRNRSCFYRTLMHRLLTKTSGSVLVAVIGWDCSYSSRLTSKDPPPPPKMERRAAERVQSHSSYLPASLRMPPPPHRSAEAEKKQWCYVRKRHGLLKLCNWFSKPERSEVAVHVELNWGLRLYRHSYKLLPILRPERMVQTKPRRESCSLPWRCSVLHLWCLVGQLLRATLHIWSEMVLKLKWPYSISLHACPKI